LDCFL